MRQIILQSMGVMTLSLLILALGTPSRTIGGGRFHSHFGFGHGFHGRQFHQPKFFVFPRRQHPPPGFFHFEHKPFHDPRFFFPHRQFQHPRGGFHHRR